MFLYNVLYGTYVPIYFSSRRCSKQQPQPSVLGRSVHSFGSENRNNPHIKIRLLVRSLNVFHRVVDKSYCTLHTLVDHVLNYSGAFRLSIM